MPSIQQFTRLVIGVVLLSLGVSTLHSENIKPNELAKYRAELAKLTKAVISQRSKGNAAALKSFVKHGASPATANVFYLECLKKLRFTDEGKKAEAWRTYREDNDAEINSVYHRQAKQMELRYLTLTINAAHAVERRDLMPKLISYMDALLGLDGRAFEFMEGADSSVFTEAYDIQNSIDPGDWQMDPTNVAGIYDAAVLPHMRKHRDPRLVTAWRSKIDHMKKHAERVKEGEEKAQRETERDERRQERSRGGGRGGGRFGGNPETSAEARVERDRYEEFQTETLPETKWAMCEDLVEHGFLSEAIPLMFRVIREHAEYKEVPAWLGKLDTDLQGAATEAKQEKAAKPGS